MNILRTIIGFFLVVLVSVVFIPVCLVLFLLRIIGLKRFANFVMYKIVQGIVKVIIFSIGCKIIVSGYENIPVHKENDCGLCFVSNHCGIFDVLVLFSTVKYPIGFITKKEIMFIPLINIWVILLGGFFLDRKNPRKALKTINQSIDRIKNGHSIAIFPEGTRSRGRGLLPFKSGSFKMAVDSGAVIVPTAITGSYEVFEQKGYVQARTVYLSFGKVITANDFNEPPTRQMLSEKTRGEIEKMLEKQIQ
ncbi:1-acyl-sn-glycerol-3-phosphate acyltransferase [Spirochaetia bacterium]|nr:1-acyl-sn-glycerol-3-phosphate acyltransferase [Spirochaetia bacterium]